MRKVIADDGATSVAAAGLITAMAFSGLTLVAFVTRKDLSFLRPIVMYGFVAALVLIVAAALFGLSLLAWQLDWDFVSSPRLESRPCT